MALITYNNIISYFTLDRYYLIKKENYLLLRIHSKFVVSM
jgi:hypothetical protein